MKYSQYTSMPEQVKRPNPLRKMMTRIIKYPQYMISCTFIHKNFTATYFTSLISLNTHFTSLAVTDDWTNSLYIIIIFTTNCRF